MARQLSSFTRGDRGFESRFLQRIAERVVAAFARAQAEGSAAIQLDGKFIDYPIVYRAQRVLEKIAAIRVREQHQ